MRGAGTQLLSAYLIAFLCGAPAYAAPRLLPSPDFYAARGSTKVLVVVAPLDARAKAQAGVVEQTAEEALDASDRFQALRAIDAFDSSAASGRASKEQEARKLMAEAKQALDDLDSAKASKLYTDAIAAWQAADLTRGIDGLVEAWTGKAAGHAVSEENKEAKAELEKVLVLAPKTKLSDAQFPPELLKYAEGQRKQLAKAKGKLTVRTEPPGARVWIDGSYRGTSPVTWEGVPAGQHMVVAGLGGWSMVVDDLPPGDHLLRLKPAEGAYGFDRAIEKIAKDPDGAQRDAAAKELGSLALADQVLLIVVKKGVGDGLDATAVRLDPKDGHNFAYAKGSFSADFVNGLLASDDPRDGKRPVTHYAGGGGGGLSGLRIAGLGLIGGALIAGVSWGIFGFSALDAANRYRTTLQVEAMKSNQAATTGRTFALVADISWAVGAALLVAGVVMVLLGGSGGGSSAKARPQKQDDALEQYRRQQEEQRRQEEEKKKESEQQQQQQQQQQPAPAPEEQPKPAPEEKKPEEAPKPAAQEEKPKKLTPAEERAERKRKAEEEKAEKKRKAEEEKAEKKRKAEEEKQRKAEEKKKAEDEKRAAEEEKKRKAEEEKQRKAEEKKKAEDEKRAAEEEKQRKADEAKKAEEEKKKSSDEEEQKKKDAEEARRMDEERKRREEEEERRRKEREQQKQDEKKEKPPLDEDLRNF